ncbi:MAG TPA: hypothetical protein VN833_31845 [Candidatus Acidoferrales bacterium]|nr:hypothetical protein [Candidatus Acidoferrales bacterium]
MAALPASGTPHNVQVGFGGVYSLNIHDADLFLASAQPLDKESVEPFGRVQWNPVAGVINLLVAPPCFHELSRDLHAFTVEVVIV